MPPTLGIPPDPNFWVIFKVLPAASCLCLNLLSGKWTRSVFRGLEGRAVSAVEDLLLRPTVLRAKPWVPALDSLREREISAPEMKVRGRFTKFGFHRRR